MGEQLIGINELGRRENPDYSRVTGLINRELAKRLRVYVAESESTISEVVEKALKKYLDEVQDTKKDTKIS
jgi:hypothetical protein